MIGLDACAPRLLIRPIPQLGESWPGYLIRLAAGNGVLGIAGLAKLLETKQLSLLTANPRHLLLQLGVRWKLESMGCAHDNLEPNRWHMHSRICPQCIQADSIHFVRAAWDNPMLLRCEVHDILLVDRCGNCNVPLNRKRATVGQCNCGEEFSESPSVKPPQWLSRMEDVFSLTSERRRSTNTFAGHSYQSRMAARALLILFQRDVFHQLTGQSRHTRNAFVRNEDLDRLAPWFEDWPRGFVENYSWVAGVSRENRDYLFSPRVLNAHLFPEFEKAIGLCDVGRRRRAEL